MDSRGRNQYTSNVTDVTKQTWSEYLDELYRAREALRNIGGDRRSESFSVPNGTLKSWSDYLTEVGLAKSTVHRWLERYIPEERKLLTPEELEARKQIETRAKKARTHPID